MAASKFIDIKILKGEETIHKYQFNSNTAEHFFVKIAAFIPIIDAGRIQMNMLTTSRTLKE